MLDVLGQVQAAWVDVLAAEAAIPVADERLAVAQRLEREVARRVGRALDPLFAGERAHTAVAQARIARDKAVETARIARASLAASTEEHKSEIQSLKRRSYADFCLNKK